MAERSGEAVWITRLEPPAERQRVAVKDLFDTAGIRTTYGSSIFADHVPEGSAAAVTALEDAGYSLAGKANLHEFAYGITSQNPHYGDVPNPRFPHRIAGGSSGGSAAAVVAGEADLGLGTDSGGSIRIPAACCEIVGFKPTYGLAAIEGCFPLAPSFDHVGPLAADVAGCAAAMQALGAGVPDGPDALADLRVAIAWLEHAEPEVAEVVRTATEMLPHRQDLDLPLPEGVGLAFRGEIAEVHRELFSSNEARYGQNVRTKISGALALDDSAVAEGRAARARYRETLGAWPEGFDLIATPTLPVVPPPRSADDLAVRDALTLFTFPFNVTGAPALALPAGRTRDDLPVSIQMVGPPGSDALVLAAGALLETALRNTPASDTRRRERGA